MADRSTSPTLLYHLYAQYVGEPQSQTDVYGYWVLIAGYLVGILGVIAFLGAIALTPAPQLPIRAGAFVLVAIALPLMLLGIVLMLPVRRRGVQVAILGGALAIAGVIGFIAVSPTGGGVSTTTTLVISAVYGVGVAVIAGTAVLVPVVTDERSTPFESTPQSEPTGDQPAEIEPTTDRSDVVLGEMHTGALFAVFSHAGNWTWRLIEETAIADSSQQYSTRPETENRVERVKSQIADAGTLEIRDAAFRIYGVEDDLWRWVLMREDGSVVADGGSEFATRDAASESVNLLKEYGPDAELLSVDGMAVEYYGDDGRWRWRLLDSNRNAIASSTSAHSDREDVAETVQTMKAAVTDAELLQIDPFGIELYERDEAWEWRLLDADTFQIAAGEGAYESRTAVETVAYDLLENLETAPVISADTPLYEVVPSGSNTWQWRLVDTGDETVAHGREETAQSTEAEESATRLKSRAADADVFAIDGTAFEVYTADDGWRWRLVDEDRNTIAVSDARYEDRDLASEAVQRVREQAVEAELIEFETAAYQIYAAGDREWRWRLIDETGEVLADSGEDFQSRDEAAASMETVKQYAPEADLLEIETAAFELYDDDEGMWYWRLIDETGDLIARAGESHPSRQAARLAMDRLVESAPEAILRTMEDAEFQVYITDEDDWSWRFIVPDGTIVATGARDHATRDQVQAALEDLRSTMVEASIETIESLAITITEHDGTWQWEIVDTDREPLAASARTYSDQDQLLEELQTIRQHTAETIVFGIEDFAFRLRERDEGWDWQLIDEDHTAMAASAQTYASNENARRAVDMVRREAPEADSIEYETAAFEVIEEEDGWRWRLIDDEEEIIATSTEVHDSRDGAVEELQAIKAVVGDASILEIETAAFELHGDEEGWRWRIVDANGDVIGRSFSSYSERSDAREAMQTAKEFGPTARTAVAEYE